MKSKIMATVIFYSLISCAGPQGPVPPMPNFSTEKGKSCARTCQSIFATCGGGCSKMIGGMLTVMPRQQCFDNCNRTLGDCYSTCE